MKAIKQISPATGWGARYVSAKAGAAPVIVPVAAWAVVDDGERADYVVGLITYPTQAELVECDEAKWAGGATFDGYELLTPPAPVRR